MITYIIWTNKNGLTYRTKHGWSWYAFLFGFVWALYKKMIVTAIASIVIYSAFIFFIDFTITNESESDIEFLYLICSLINGLIFGAYGNQWIEKKLLREGYEIRETKYMEQNTYWVSLFRYFKIYFEKMTLFCKNNFVISSILFGIISSILVSLVLTPNLVIDRFHQKSELEILQEKIKDLPIHSFIESSNRAVLNGYVDTKNLDTYVWFEWGETPDLGLCTRKQLLRTAGTFYQEINELKPSTRYYYMVKSESRNGIIEGKVLSFTTAPND